MSKFDQLYRRVLISKFFTKGWGKPDNLKRLFEFRQVIANRETCQTLVSPDYPVYIDKEYVQGNIRTLEGHFVSPFSRHLPGVMPKEVEIAKCYVVKNECNLYYDEVCFRFQVILPKSWKSKLRPICLHLAGTGDHFFWRRRALIGKPLLKEAGVASIILENPYYGERKPKQQIRSSLHNVSDLFVMGGALVLESIVLLHWCERQGYGPLAITGISMGGHMASAAATNWHKPVSLVPCLSWSTASCSFTQGVMSAAIPWDLLQSQYFENSVYEKELRRLMHSPEDDAYQLGQKFVQSYSSSLETMDRIRGSRDDNKLNRSKQDERSMFLNKFSLGSNSTPQYYNSPGQKSVFVSLPSPTAFLPRKKKTSLRTEALDFMRGVMDEFTHLGNFSRPLDTELIIIVAAKKDAYIPRDKVRSLEDIWPGVEVRYIDTGHIAAFLFKQDVFRKAICETLQRQAKKYYS